MQLLTPRRCSSFSARRFDRHAGLDPGLTLIVEGGGARQALTASGMPPAVNASGRMSKLGKTRIMKLFTRGRH